MGQNSLVKDPMFSVMFRLYFC